MFYLDKHIFLTLRIFSNYKPNIMDDFSTLTIIISAIISLIIMFYLIKGAVSSGTKEMRDQLVIQNRLKSKQLFEAGISRDELLKINDVNAEDFWKTLLTPEQKEQYDREFKALSESQQKLVSKSQ